VKRKDREIERHIVQRQIVRNFRNHGKQCKAEQIALWAARNPAPLRNAECKNWKRDSPHGRQQSVNHVRGFDVHPQLLDIEDLGKKHFARVVDDHGDYRDPLQLVPCQLESRFSQFG
jgi:hypothetical protein